MVHLFQPDRLGLALEWHVSRGEDSAVVVTLYERVDRVAIGCYGCASYRSMLVLENLRCLYSLGPTPNCFLVSPVNILDSHRNIGHSISMGDDVPRDWMVGYEGGGQ